MHYHLEIIMPPTDDVEAAVRTILNPFSEHSDDRGEDGKGTPFWDYCTIGGRYSGSKYQAQFDPAKLDQFRQWLTEQKVTVSGLQWGKEELSPSSQIPMIDAKWNEMFTPEGQSPVACPLFKHSGAHLPMDVCTLKEAPRSTGCFRCIIAVPGYANGGWALTNPPEAEFMLAESEWNGCNHAPMKFDGTLQDCLAQFKTRLENCSESYTAACTPTDDWLVVTVDYHS